MAQLISKSGKAAPAVDLTPMVDLGFLLIAFFMFTTTMSKPFAMNIQMPYKEDRHLTKPAIVKESTAMTILLGKDHQVHYYEGMPDEDLERKIVRSGFEGDGNIRDKITRKKAAIKELVARGELRPGDQLTVMIKATDQATTDDLVKMLDEMSINKVPVYTIVDLTVEELGIMKKIPVLQLQQ